MLGPLLTKLSIAGPLTAAQLRASMAVSPATLSRMVAAESPRVLRLGRARATWYAALRVLPGLPQALPIYRIDRAGKVQRVAYLTPIEQRGSWFELEDGPGRIHEGLPPAIADMAPAGYLGRRFAARHPELGLPHALNDWSDDHRLIALALRGEDAPGDLIIGELSLERHLRERISEARKSDYPRLAEASALGGAGSSAAGEQPKFTAFRDGAHRIVKFTRRDGSAGERRWHDLLVCESLALEVLAGAGISASQAQVIDRGEWRFLEVGRFDREGERGRRGAITLAPIDDELFGQRDSWTEAAGRLVQAKLLSKQDARTVRLLEAFGILIGNNDRHFGNLAFFADGLLERPELLLAPAYDMVPMDLAPRAGILPPLLQSEPPMSARLIDVWEEAQDLARTLWARVSRDPRITSELCRQALRRAK